MREGLRHLSELFLFIPKSECLKPDPQGHAQKIMTYKLSVLHCHKKNFRSHPYPGIIVKMEFTFLRSIPKKIKSFRVVKIIFSNNASSYDEYCGRDANVNPFLQSKKD